MPESLPDLTPPEPSAPLAHTYISRPVEITAVQWDGTEAHAARIVEWMESHVGRGCACLIPEQEPLDMGYVDSGKPILLARPARIVIGLHTGGQTDLFATDWLIRGVEGEFYPCKDSVFQKKYQRRIGHTTWTAEQIRDAALPLPTMHILIQNGKDLG